MTIVLKAENISKKYIISHTANSGRYKYSTIRDSIYSIFSNKNKQEKEDFWALKDINFEINQGDKIGIIGRNGAGKSTLLKILSRITDPTTGKISIKGKIASLLEVGTGFHPELTGRENIFLNGSILGMTHKEIKKKFDEIVEFSGVENFLDTPVKRYSSGMYVRLAFSVAAHLETDILLVDEVLAVGDAEFQKKCLGKMDDISKSEGRTILFVSHNMVAIQNLCPYSFLIKNGTIIMKDKTEYIITSYISDFNKNDIDILSRKDRNGNGIIRFSNFKLKYNNNKYTNIIRAGEDVYFEITIINNSDKTLKNLIISLGIDFNAQRIIYLSNSLTFDNLGIILPGKNIINIKVEKFPLRKGEYTFTLFSSMNNDILDWVMNAGSFMVEDGDFFNTGQVMPSDQSLYYLNHKMYLEK